VSDQVNCFGLHRENAASCESCHMKRRCKSVTLSEGFTAVADLVDHLEATLPDGYYPDTDRVTELVDLLVRGPGISENLLPGVTVTPEDVTAELI